MMGQNLDFIRAGILGLIVGDALGVPAEFRSRDEMKHCLVTDMTEYGTHYQPRGTWSDDSSMTLCALDSLCKGFDLNDMMEKFCDWLYSAEYTPWGACLTVD